MIQFICAALINQLVIFAEGIRTGQEVVQDRQQALVVDSRSFETDVNHSVVADFVVEHGEASAPSDQEKFRSRASNFATSSSLVKSSRAKKARSRKIQTTSFNPGALDRTRASKKQARKDLPKQKDLPGFEVRTRGRCVFTLDYNECKQVSISQTEVGRGCFPTGCAPIGCRPTGVLLSKCRPDCAPNGCFSEGERFYWNKDKTGECTEEMQCFCKVFNPGLETPKMITSVGSTSVGIHDPFETLNIDEIKVEPMALDPFVLEAPKSTSVESTSVGIHDPFETLNIEKKIDELKFEPMALDPVVLETPKSTSVESTSVGIHDPFETFDIDEIKSEPHQE